MSDLVGNPEDRFSRDAAQLLMHKVVATFVFLHFELLCSYSL